MKPLKIKNVYLEDSAFVPVLTLHPRSLEELEEDVKNVKEIPVDVLEWRADYLEGEPNTIHDLIVQGLKILRENFPNHVLIFTFRSIKEGGQFKVSDQRLYELRKIALESSDIDVIDMELFWFTQEKDLSLRQKYLELIKHRKHDEVKILMSYHDFKEMNKLPDFKHKFLEMMALEADIAKIAISIPSKNQLEEIKRVSKDIVTKISIPHILIAMGEAGKPSRYDSENFASCLTYVTHGEKVAEGQLHINEFAQYRGNNKNA